MPAARAAATSGREKLCRVMGVSTDLGRSVFQKLTFYCQDDGVKLRQDAAVWDAHTGGVATR